MRAIKIPVDGAIEVVDVSSQSLSGCSTPVTIRTRNSHWFVTSMCMKPS